MIMTYTDFTKYIGKNLKDARLAQGLTQQEFSKISGIDVCYISYVENGHRNIRLKTLFKFINNLEIEPHSIFTENKDYSWL